MDDERFLRELEERLQENRQIVEGSFLPKFLIPGASYLAFHTFRSLLVFSFVVTVGLFWLWFRPLIELGKQLFFYQ